MPVPVEEEVNLVVLLWAYPGSSDRLVAYEDLVLEFLASHGGRLLHRLRTKGEDDAPFEIQVIRFLSEASYENYLTDQRRVNLRELSDTSVARTEVHRGYGVTILPRRSRDDAANSGGAATLLLVLHSLVRFESWRW